MPIYGVGYTYSNTSSVYTYLRNNDGNYKKLRLKGYILGKCTTSGYTRNISFSFGGYLKTETGYGSYKSIKIAELSASSTSAVKKEFDTEINLEELYFPIPYNQTYAPRFVYGLGGTYGNIMVYVEEMVWIK